MDPLTASLVLGGVGAGLGGLGALFGKKGKFKQQPLYSPQQQSALDRLLQQGLAGSDFGPIEQQARSQFQSNTIPSLAERFTSLGGGQRSSAFQGALGSAASGLEQGLASLKSQHGLQQLGMGLGQQFENVYFPSQPGFFEGISGGFNQALPSLFQMQMQRAQDRRQTALLERLLGGA